MLNDCREGVHGGAGVALTDSGADGRHLKGASSAMRAKRDAIYRRALLLLMIRALATGTALRALDAPRLSAGTKTTSDVVLHQPWQCCLAFCRTSFVADNITLDFSSVDS